MWALLLLHLMRGIGSIPRFQHSVRGQCASGQRAWMPFHRRCAASPVRARRKSVNRGRRFGHHAASRVMHSTCLTHVIAPSSPRPGRRGCCSGSSSKEYPRPGSDVDPLLLRLAQLASHSARLEMKRPAVNVSPAGHWQHRRQGQRHIVFRQTQEQQRAGLALLHLTPGLAQAAAASWRIDPAISRPPQGAWPRGLRLHLGSLRKPVAGVAAERAATSA
jgi:hypothetical protein